MKLFRFLPVIAFTTLSMQGGSKMVDSSAIRENIVDSDVHQKLSYIIENELGKNFSEITVKKGTLFPEINELLINKIYQLMRKYSDFHIFFDIEEIINSIEPGRETEVDHMIVFFEITYLNPTKNPEYEGILISIKQFPITVKYLN